MLRQGIWLMISEENSGASDLVHAKQRDKNSRAEVNGHKK